MSNHQNVIVALALACLACIAYATAAPDDNSGQILAVLNSSAVLVSVEQSEDLADVPAAAVVLRLNSSAPGLRAGQWIYFDLVQPSGAGYLARIFLQVGEAPARIGEEVGA